MNGLRVLALGLAVVWCGCSGCKKAAQPASGPVVPALPTAAQPKLTTTKLWLGAEQMTAELALTPMQQETGMMFRTNMEEDSGMLFPLPNTQTARFWMTNCPLPLSAAYIDPEGVIQEIHELKANDATSVDSATDNIRFVLEAPKGWFERHHITTGTVVRTEQDTLMETFFGGR
jgi:uncharacterized protein